MASPAETSTQWQMLQHVGQLLGMVVATVELLEKSRRCPDLPELHVACKRVHDAALELNGILAQISGCRRPLDS